MTCKHVKRTDWCYYNVSGDENPQTQNEMDSPSIEGFTLCWIVSLRTVIKIKHSLYSYSIYSFVFKNKTEQNNNGDKCSLIVWVSVVLRRTFVGRGTDVLTT